MTGKRYPIVARVLLSLTYGVCWKDFAGKGPEIFRTKHQNLCEV
jgi:hypothetical protein